MGEREGIEPPAVFVAQASDNPSASGLALPVRVQFFYPAWPASRTEGDPRPGLACSQPSHHADAHPPPCYHLPSTCHQVPACYHAGASLNRVTKKTEESRPDQIETSLMIVRFIVTAYEMALTRNDPPARVPQLSGGTHQSAPCTQAGGASASAREARIWP